MASVQIDDQFDLFGGFVAEIEGYLPVIAANVRQLLTAPGSEDLLEESHRYAHTIKSSAAMIGIPELRSIATPLEALLARAYAGDVAVDDAVVAAVDGTLLRIRTCLALQQAGSDLRDLIRENDQAYAGLRTVAPGAQRPPSEDARDRLLHAGVALPVPILPEAEDAPATPLAAELVDAGSPEALLQPEGEPSGPVDAPAEVVIADPSDGEVMTGSASLSPTPANVEWRTAPPERPHLSLLTGGTASDGSPANGAGAQSIAAEWLAEILGTAPDRPAPAPPPAEAAPDGAAQRSKELARLRQEWEQRLDAERAALEAQLEQTRQDAQATLEAERLAFAEQRQALLAQHERALQAAAEERERALLEQRDALEQEVQRYIADDLRPQLEDEIRQEVSHEFEVAALLDPAPSVREARPRAPSPAYSYADDPALAAEMRAIFAQEAAEHIQAIGEQTLALRQSPDDPEHLRALRRSIHTLKGASATVGLAAVSTLCHQVESALDRQLEEGVLPGGPGQIVLLLESCDVLEALIGGDDDASAQARTLAEQLSALTGLALPSAQPEAAKSATPDLTSPATDGHVLDAAPDWATAPPEETLTGPAASTAHTTEAGAARSANLALRVSLGDLDRLLAANHELIITESAVELRLQRLQRTLGDVRHTGDRLRAAGSRLESGSSYATLLAGGAAPEAPGPAPVGAGGRTAPSWRDALRRQPDAQAAGEFDALEMDRYTEFHRLTREIAEAALDVTASDAEIGDVLDDLRVTLKQQQRLHASQNEVLLQARMVPLRVLLPRLARSVQAVAAQQGKQVDFVVEGQETLLDRAVMDDVAGALLHLVRNAVDHGVELPAARLAAGKAATGTIRLSAQRVGPEISIVLTDDGPGLDTEAIRRSALSRGLISQEARLSEHDLQQLVFTPGLSTAATVTDISGRGVGLDVVRANVQALRGEVSLTSHPGAGTTFTVKVPSSLSLLAVALVEAVGNTYAIPLTLVRHVERMAARRIQTEDGRQVVHHGGRIYPVVELAELLGLPAPRNGRGQAPLSLVFIGAAPGTVALTVDALAGKREVVVKDLGPQLRSVRGVHGATALGNGELALILDVPTLLQQEQTGYTEPLRAPRETPRPQQLLVVDDSPSVRRLTCAVFERQGWEVRQARDGVEALDLLQGWRPDAIVMDIEMPRMDGFELLAILRRQLETADVPAVMVTSRAGEKHREKAVRLGIDAYLVKPFREEELLGTVDSLLPHASLTVPAAIW